MRSDGWLVSGAGLLGSKAKRPRFAVEFGMGFALCVFAFALPTWTWIGLDNGPSYRSTPPLLCACLIQRKTPLRDCGRRSGTRRRRGTVTGRSCTGGCTCERGVQRVMANVRPRTRLAVCRPPPKRTSLLVPRYAAGCPQLSAVRHEPKSSPLPPAACPTPTTRRHSTTPRWAERS